MPVRALRHITVIFSPPIIFLSESINAREGIKTGDDRSLVQGDDMSESINAREGIKTDGVLNNLEIAVNESESINAREGIKTDAIRPDLGILICRQNQ